MQSIRKEKRNMAAMAKRRTITTRQDTESLVGLSNAISALRSPDIAAAKSGVATIRELLSLQEDAPIAECHKQNVAELLTQFLGRVSDVQTQIAVAWCLTNLATGTHEETGKVLVAAPQLVAFLGSTVAELSEQAAWALGNIASDSQGFRLELLKLNVLDPLVNVLRSEVNGEHWGLKHRSLWLLSHLARGYESPAEIFMRHKVHEVLFAILRVTLDSGPILEEKTAAIVSEVMWCFSYLCAKEVEFLSVLVDAGLIRACTLVLCSTVSGKDLNIEILTPTLRALGNISGVENLQWKFEIARQSEVLSSLCVILDEWEDYKDLGNDAAWLASNLCAYGAHPVEEGAQVRPDVAAKTSEAFLPRLYWLLCNGNFDSQSEAAYGLAKIAAHEGNDALIWMLTQPEKRLFIDTVMTKLRKSDVDTTETILDLLTSMFTKLNNPFVASKLGGNTGVDIVKGANGVESFESVYYGNLPKQTCDRAGSMLDKFLTDDDCIEEETNEASSNGLNLDRLTTSGIARGRASVLPAWVTRENSSSEGAPLGAGQQKTLEEYGFRNDGMDE